LARISALIIEAKEMNGVSGERSSSTC